VGIFFITGTSGAGKTTLQNNLELHLDQDTYEIYDFDQNGVPENADAAWRQKTTDYWLMRAHENAAKNKSTVICGVSVPTEVMHSMVKVQEPIYFGFIQIADQIIHSRLERRGWSEQLIQDNINWAHYLEADVKKYPLFCVFDSDLNKSADELAVKVAQWIKSFFPMLSK
jgi:broad-specificity NMP kinase